MSAHRDHSRLEWLELLLCLGQKVNVNFQTVFVFQSVDWEKHLIWVSVSGTSASHHKYFGSRFLNISLKYLLFSRPHMLKALFNIQAGEGSYLDGS